MHPELAIELDADPVIGLPAYEVESIVRLSQDLLDTGKQIPFEKATSYLFEYCV